MKLRVFYVVFFMGLSQLLFAQQTQIGKYTSYNYDGKKLLIIANHGKIEITPFTNQIFRVAYFADSIKYDIPYSLNANPQPVKTTLKQTNTHIWLIAAALSVKINKQNLALSFYLNGKPLMLNNYNYNAQNNGSKTLNFKINPNQSMYGLGSHALAANRKGELLENYHQAHYGYTAGEKTLNVSIPFFVTDKNYGVYFDNYGSGFFDLGKTKSDLLSYQTNVGVASYFVIGGNNYDEILNNYTKLTGKQPLPPRWVLGFMQSRFGYRSQQEMMDIATKTKADGFPIDVMILDIYWYAAEIAGIGNMDWYKTAFPDAPKMMADLRNMGIKTIPITQTFATLKSVNYQTSANAKLFAGGINEYPYVLKKFWAGPASLLDVFKPETQNYLWSNYKNRIKEGVAGFWTDLGEPEMHSDSMQFVLGNERQVHNIYPLTWNKFIYQNYRKDFPNQRVFNLTRSGGAGMQRFGTFTWSGDVSRNWEAMKIQIPIITGMGMSGVGYMHPDAGGFTKGDKDAELYTRWIQMASFLPIIRAHADVKLASSDPNAVGKTISTKDDIAYPEPIFWDEATKNIVREYLNLRYRYLPYNYTLAWLNTKTARPLVLPVGYFDTQNKALKNLDDEYLWGANILVAPVFTKGAITRKVVFPAGKWIDTRDFKTYTNFATVNAPITSMPVFAKAGSIIPMANAMPNTDAYNTNTLILKYYADQTVKSSTFNMYLDDGITPDAEKKGEFEMLKFKATNPVRTGLATHTISLQKTGTFIGAPQQRDVFIEIPRVLNVPTKVLNGKIILRQTNTDEELTNQTNLYYYDTKTKVLKIHVKWNGKPVSVKLVNLNIR
jgi:oligosaccharide 4-alpha-D-glucosyltransferase